MNDHPHPSAPLQVIEPNWTQLPRYDPEYDKRPPDWVHASVQAWARGSVEITDEDLRFIDPRRYEPAFVLDGIEWDWRHDGFDVWTLVHIMPWDICREMFGDDDDDIPLDSP